MSLSHTTPISGTTYVTILNFFKQNFLFCIIYFHIIDYVGMVGVNIIDVPCSRKWYLCLIELSMKRLKISKTFRKSLHTVTHFSLSCIAFSAIKSGFISMFRVYMCGFGCSNSKYALFSLLNLKDETEIKLNLLFFRYKTYCFCSPKISVKLKTFSSIPSVFHWPKTLARRIISTMAFKSFCRALIRSSGKQVLFKFVVKTSRPWAVWFSISWMQSTRVDISSSSLFTHSS